MSAFVKEKLKAAREAISKKQYDKARDTASEVLEYEPDNYNANVFLGLALLNLKQTEQSAQAYRKAIAANPSQPLAWQGLSQLYEQSRDWQKYAEALERLGNAFAEANDSVKCAETLQKLVDFRRGQGDRMQLAETLAVLLPESPLYPTLSTLPPPDPTNPSSTTTYLTQSAVHNSLPILEEIVTLHETEEEETTQKEVSKRRMRLGAASPAQIQQEVAREVLQSSKLPGLYNEILNHLNTSDELRRQTESKLLRHKQRYLYALPTTDDAAATKAKLFAELEELISGMILLGIKDELAWTMSIENKDAEDIEHYDYSLLRQYISLFPHTSLAKLIIGYFGHVGMPVFGDHGEGDGPAVNGKLVEDDYIDMILDAFGDLQESLLAHRIVAELYEAEEDYENTIKVAESGLELVARAEQNNGKPLPFVRKAFNVVLATSLVHYFPPKHHTRALGIIDQILARDADNIPSLMGRGYIMQYTSKWDEANELFGKVAKMIPDDADDGLRAKEEHAWCQLHLGTLGDAASELKEVLNILDEMEERGTDKARCWWRLGRCYWDMGDAYREEAYKYFITALKRSSTFAPAFTSLGIYYSEFLSPPDPNRASKCFQKAFELDPREADAARRLAEGFAEEREWDLVEVVARRTIDGEGGLEGGTATARYLPINAWAWKAVGVVELNRQNYPPAIQAFQVALRTDADDQLSWLRLGEAYSKAGRFAAALKALEHAREINPDDWICSYFIGEVQRQMGDYAGAIRAFASILEKHPLEPGVLLSLSQAYVELGRVEAQTAYTTRAQTSFVDSLGTTLHLMDASPGFRRVAWKIAADALFHLSGLTLTADEEPVRALLARVVPLVSEQQSKKLSGIIATQSSDGTADLAMNVLETAISAYDYRISLDALDDQAKASAHYDLGMALLSYAHRLPAGSKQEHAREESIAQYKEALRWEPGNEQYWNALGCATFETQPRIAQHAYIRALEINSKNTGVWANLGLFYLHHDDAELANEAFYKAQILDPEYALAWIGQGLVATVNGHAPEARALFEHAIGLAAPIPQGDIEFSKRLLEKVNTSPSTLPSAAELLFPAFFVMDRFCREQPPDASALHLFGLVCERIGHLELGVDMIDRAIALLEATYEETEDPVIERRFAIAHINAARVRLALRDYGGSLESFQLALGLLPEQAETKNGRILLTHAQFGSGLVHFKLGQLGDALGQFEAALSTAAEDPLLRGHVAVLLAQNLWAMGTEDGRESAKNQLLQSIEMDPENLLAVNTLAGMGILTDDDSLVDAALSEILGLPLDQRLARDPAREVTYLLIQHHLGQNDTTTAVSVAQKAVLAEPGRPEIRQRLATLDFQQGHYSSALAVLAGSSSTRENNIGQLRESLYLLALARCLNPTHDPSQMPESHHLAEKAVMLAPWDRRTWQTLAFVHGTASSSSEE